VLSRAHRLPPGQHLHPGFPVLDLGIRPAFDPAAWRLTVDGEVAQPLELTWQEFTALPRTRQVSDFHCVTTWSIFGVKWGGVKFKTIVEMAKPLPGAAYLIQTCNDGYTTNLPLGELGGADVLLAYELNGEPLPVEHGGPMRLIVPHLYAWKSAKFLTRLTFQEQDRPGYWEELGYHDRADPWKEERYR
jgi:DMSO/TMAO reductase YedYZ molybdopterin-dependent catalytic subunit